MNYIIYEMKPSTCVDVIFCLNNKCVMLSGMEVFLCSCYQLCVGGEHPRLYLCEHKHIVLFVMLVLALSALQHACLTLRVFEPMYLEQQLLV